MKNERKENYNKKVGFEAAEEISAADLAWKMFKKSGNINYYRLYSDLKKKDE